MRLQEGIGPDNRIRRVDRAAHAHGQTHREVIFVAGIDPRRRERTVPQARARDAHDRRPGRRDECAVHVGKRVVGLHDHEQATQSVGSGGEAVGGVGRPGTLWARLSGDRVVELRATRRRREQLREGPSDVDGAAMDDRRRDALAQPPLGSGHDVGGDARQARARNQDQHGQKGRYRATLRHIFPCSMAAGGSRWVNWPPLHALAKLDEDQALARTCQRFYLGRRAQHGARCG